MLPREARLVRNSLTVILKVKPTVYLYLSVIQKIAINLRSSTTYVIKQKQPKQTTTLGLGS